MNLQRLLSTSVVLACALAVFAAPIADTDDTMDIETREPDTDSVMMGGFASRAVFPEAYRSYNVYAYDRRGGPAKPPAPRPKTPPPTVAPPKKPATPPPQAPKQSPPNQRPNQTPPKQTLPKQTPPKQNPPKQNPPKSTPPKSTPPKQNPPKQEPPKRPDPNQPTPKKPEPAPKNENGSCPAPGKDKAKRAFSTTCDTTILRLNGIARYITKVNDQGNSAITYKVDGGWPDPTTGQDVTAYAKTGKRPGGSFAEEARWLSRTDQLLAEGSYDGHQFIVFHGVTGKEHIVKTDYWRSLAERYLVRGDIARCQADVRRKLELVVREARYYVEQYGVLHTDIQPGNILWDSAATDPTLIDWGKAEEVTRWSTEIETRVRRQAEFSHLQGDEKICIDLR